MGESVAETCWADLKRLINEKFVASFWLFTSLILGKMISFWRSMVIRNVDCGLNAQFFNT